MFFTLLSKYNEIPSYAGSVFSKSPRTCKQSLTLFSFMKGFEDVFPLHHSSSILPPYFHNLPYFRDVHRFACIFFSSKNHTRSFFLIFKMASFTRSSFFLFSFTYLYPLTIVLYFPLVSTANNVHLFNHLSSWLFPEASTVYFP